MAETGKWKKFEHLVAAIHRAADQGAIVRWNETINGRQFDVTIRFRKGLYEYLTVIECKDQRKPVSVDKVEAFVTKAADAHAHHGVMASTSGFQAGALKVAEKHNLTLIHVTESSEVDLSLFGAHWAGFADSLHLARIELEYEDGERVALPEQAHAMTYYVNHVLLVNQAEKTNLHTFLQRHMADFIGGPAESYRDHVISCAPGTRIVAPNDGEIPLKPLARVHVRAGMAKARVMAGPAIFEPYLLLPDVKVQNMTTGEEQTFNQHELPIEFDTVFEEGKFYEQPRLAMYYYCDRIEGDIATIYLIESFQVGQLVQARLRVKVAFANRYLEVKDSQVIRRLQRRLDRLKSRKSSG